MLCSCLCRRFGCRQAVFILVVRMNKGDLALEDELDVFVGRLLVEMNSTRDLQHRKQVIDGFISVAELLCLGEDVCHARLVVYSVTALGN